MYEAPRFFMDKKHNGEVSDVAIVSPGQRNARAINDFDLTPSPSVTSSLAYDKHPASSRSIQPVRSETEQRYKAVGNINVINQMYAIFNKSLSTPIVHHVNPENVGRQSRLRFTFYVLSLPPKDVALQNRRIKVTFSRIKSQGEQFAGKLTMRCSASATPRPTTSWPRVWRTDT